MSQTIKISEAGDLEMTGATYPVRDTLRAAGWRWDASRKSWGRRAVVGEAVAVVPGCTLTLYASAGYAIALYDVGQSTAPASRQDEIAALALADGLSMRTARAQYESGERA